MLLDAQAPQPYSGFSAAATSVDGLGVNHACPPPR
jgi:hypothetical protein